MNSVLFIDSLEDVETRAASGIGSTVYKLAAAAEATENNWQVDYLTTKNKKLLVDGSNIFREVFTEQFCDFSKYSKIIFLGLENPGIGELQQIVPFNESDFKLYKSQAHHTFWRDFVALGLDYEKSASDIVTFFAVTKEEIEPLNNIFTPFHRWVGMSTDVVSPLKYFDGLEEVAGMLLMEHEDIKIVYLGAEKKNFETNERIINLTGSTGIRELMSVIYHCDIIVGADGLINHIAMNMDIPSVSLFSMISPENVISPSILKRDNVTALVHQGCKHQFCYSKIENYRTSGCLLNPQMEKDSVVNCMKFSPEDILKNILNIL